MITDERLREIEWATTYVTTHEAPRGCRCGGSCRRCDEWRQQAAKIPPETVLELVAELRRGRAALEWIEHHVTSPVFLDDDGPDPRNGTALVARALAETAEASS